VPNAGKFPVLHVLIPSSPVESRAEQEAQLLTYVVLTDRGTYVTRAKCKSAKTRVSRRRISYYNHSRGWAQISISDGLPRCGGLGMV
jgi:hypothetical protein